MNEKFTLFQIFKREKCEFFIHHFSRFYFYFLF